MAIIKHSDLFEFDLWDKAMKEAEKAVGQLGKTVDEVFSRLSSQQKELNATLKNYETLFKGFNINAAGAADGLKKLNTELDETIKRKKDNQDTEAGYRAAMDMTKATLAEVKAEYAALRKQYEALKPTQTDYANQVAAIKTRLTEVVPRLGEFNNAVKKTRQDVDAAEGSYRKMSNELGELRNRLRTMPNAFDPVTGAMNKNNKEAVELHKRIEQLDGVVKAADASMGIHARNVGNYASGFNGLRTSINQLTREVPSTINNLNSMFLAFSNNLPMLGDEINKLKQRNIELTASGGQAIPIWKQVAGAFFSWQTLISVGITLLTVYGEDLVEWVGSLFDSKEAVDDLRKSTEFLNEAYNSTEVAGAVKNVEELKIQVDLAKQGLIDKKEVVDLYNSTMGKTTGQLEDFASVEKRIVDAGPAYIKMMLYRAAANQALEEAAKKALEAEQKRSQLLGIDPKNEKQLPGGVIDFNQVGNKGPKPMTAVGALNRETEKDIKKAEQQGKQYIDFANSFLKQAAELSDKFNFDFSGNADDEGKNAGKEADKRAKAFLDSIRKQQELIEKAAELEIKTQELRYTRGEISELEFQNRRYNIVKNATEKLIELENRLGSKAEGSRIEGFKAKEVQAEIEFTKFMERQQEERRKLAAKSNTDVIKGREEAKKREEEIEEEQSQKFADIQNKRLQAETDAENRRYGLLKAGKNLSFLEEIQHLENLKRIRKKNAEDTTEIEFEIERRNEERKRQLKQETQDFIFAVASTGLQMLQQQSQADSESRINALQNEKDRELALAGNNAIAREKIERDYQRRIAAEKSRQAQKDKEFALFNVAINTAAAVAKTIAEWGMPLAIPFIALAIGTGLLQAALIAARPIPKFEKGTKNAPKGPAIINEAGAELIERNGRMYIVKSKGPALVSLEGGEKIYTAQETRRMLESDQKVAVMSQKIQEGRDVHYVTLQTKALQGSGITESAMQRVMNSTLGRQPVHQTIMDERGIRKREIEQNTIREYLNNRYLG